MNQLTGKELWDHIEKLARDKYKTDKTWKLTMVDLRQGFALIRLDKRGRRSIEGTVEDWEASA